MHPPIEDDATLRHSPSGRHWTSVHTEHVESATAADENSQAARPRPPPRSASAPRTKFLTGLRGLAALLVCHVHAGLLKDTTAAPSSVDIFFVLSAFLLTMLTEAKFRRLLDKHATVLEWVTTLIDYCVKRILRVYPLYAFTVLVLWVLPLDSRTEYYNLGPYNLTEWEVDKLLTLQRHYSVLWTLPIEIAYYLIIPLFVGVMCALGRAKWVLVTVLYVWVGYAGAHTNRNDHNHFRPHLSTFVAGSLAATVYGGASRWLQTNPLRRWHVAALRVIEWLLLASIISDVSRGLLVRWLHGSLFPSANASAPVVSVPASLVIVIEMVAPSAVAAALEWSVLCYAGKVSFSMYMLHLFVVNQPWMSQIHYYERFVVRLVLIFALATASFLVIEQPCQKLAATLGEKLARLTKAPPKPRKSKRVELPVLALDVVADEREKKAAGG